MSIIEINKRYTSLAESDCCLSCGGAINYAEAKENEVCVDLGSGRGTDVLRMAGEVGENGFVYGIDISEGMLAKAEKNARKLGVKNVKFIHTTLEDLKIESNTVDLIISNCTINHASDKLKVWQEVHRILKPGGRFVVSDIYSTKEVPEKYKTDPVAISECWGGSVTKNLYLSQLEQAGFKNISILEESSPYSKGEIEVSSWTIAGIKKNKCNCQS